MRLQNEVYLRAHPQVREMLSAWAPARSVRSSVPSQPLTDRRRSFVKHVIRTEPASILDSAVEFFTTADLEKRVKITHMAN